MVVPQWGKKHGVRIFAEHYLIYIRNNWAFYSIGDHHFRINKGTVLFIPKGIPFVHSCTPERPPQIFQMLFTIDNNLTSRTIPDTAKPFYLIIPVVEIMYLEILFDKLVSLHQHGRQLSSTCCSSLSHILMLHLLTEAKRYNRGFDMRLERARLHLEDNPTGPFPFEELIRRSGLSPKYFTRRYTHQYGISPKSYHVRCRCRYGKMLLEEMGYSVKETAYALGYKDPFTFSRQFSSIMGKPPRRCRVISDGY